jgi:CheY-like chemotaxis protein
VPRSGAHVLLVEDNSDIAESLSMALSFYGHHVLVAPDGAAGLAAAQAHRPEVMLVDIGLPRMNGYDLARSVRADPELDGTFLAALTAYGSPQDRRRAHEAGFDAHLVKPVHIQTLHELLIGWTKSGAAHAGGDE